MNNPHINSRNRMIRIGVAASSHAELTRKLTEYVRGTICELHDWDVENPRDAEDKRDDLMICTLLHNEVDRFEAEINKQFAELNRELDRMRGEYNRLKMQHEGTDHAE